MISRKAYMEYKEARLEVPSRSRATTVVRMPNWPRPIEYTMNTDTKIIACAAELCEDAPANTWPFRTFDPYSNDPAAVMLKRHVLQKANVD